MGSLHALMLNFRLQGQRVRSSVLERTPSQLESIWSSGGQGWQASKCAVTQQSLELQPRNRNLAQNREWGHAAAWWSSDSHFSCVSIHASLLCPLFQPFLLQLSIHHPWDKVGRHTGLKESRHHHHLFQHLPGRERRSVLLSPGLGKRGPAQLPALSLWARNCIPSFELQLVQS